MKNYLNRNKKNLRLEGISEVHLVEPLLKQGYSEQGAWVHVWASSEDRQQGDSTASLGNLCPYRKEVLPDAQGETLVFQFVLVSSSIDTGRL